jgi:hypothetical protein
VVLLSVTETAVTSANIIFLVEASGYRGISPPGSQSLAQEPMDELRLVLAGVLSMPLHG